MFRLSERGRDLCRTEDVIETRCCVGCEKSEELVVLETCRMCFRHFCGDCAHKTRGARFCSTTCGEYFMHGDEEDQEEMMREDYGQEEEDWPI